MSTAAWLTLWTSALTCAPLASPQATPAARPYPALISEARRNVELKARDPNPEQSLAVCESLGAEALGLLRQRDTYFRVPNGRLKLREEAGAVPHLIAYERPDRALGRESRYRIVEIAQAEGLKAALAGVLGIATVIAKERRLFIWEGARIHLDEVEGLGSFVEFEAPLSGAAERVAAQERIDALREAFGIADSELLGVSYCDLGASRPTAGVGPA